jgi:hypothetical protein
MKKLFKEHSPYMLFIALFESIISVLATISFVYTDSLTYSKSLVIQAMGIEKLLETMYTSTWWALVLLLVFFVALFAILTIIYKDLKFFSISFGCLVEMLILSINLTMPIKNILMNMLIFIPLFVLNIIAYKSEKKKLEESKITKKRTSKK